MGFDTIEINLVNPTFLWGEEGQLPPTSLRVKPKIEQADHFRPKSCFGPKTIMKTKLFGLNSFSTRNC